MKRQISCEILFKIIVYVMFFCLYILLKLCLFWWKIFHLMKSNQAVANALNFIEIIWHIFFAERRGDIMILQMRFIINWSRRRGLAIIISSKFFVGLLYMLAIVCAGLLPASTWAWWVRQKWLKCSTVIWNCLNT